MAGILFTKNYVFFQVRNPLGETIAEFEGAMKAGKALPGDHVVWDPQEQSCKLQFRRKHYPIAGLLEITSKTKYGMTSRGVPIYLFIPCRKEYPPMVVGCSERNITKNLYCVIDFDSWETTNLPRGNLRKVLGPCDDPKIEREALRLTYNPFKFPKKPYQNSLPQNILERTPCPTLTFNIDPPGCRDIDDVLSIQETETELELWITISDVAEYIHPGSQIDEYATLQSSTCYENGTAIIPMLPYEFSEGCCSLIPGERRLGVSLVLTFDKNILTEPRSVNWKLSTVFNTKQFTYDNFVSTAGFYGIPVESIQTIASGILKRQTSDPHEWIEAFMLFYNFHTATCLKKAQRGVLRRHSAPNLELLETYKQFQISELEMLANRSAEYCSATEMDSFHFGLEKDAYCHATSPIRRYADLINQRVLKDILLKTQIPVSPDIIWLNERQKDIKRFERDIFLLENITQNKKGSVQAIVLEIKNKKYKLWYPQWKRCMTWKPGFDLKDSIQPGQTIELTYFANPSVRHWKEKVVFHFENVI
jgi:exoribonuclease R